MSLIAPWRDARGIKSIEVQDRSGDNCLQPILGRRAASALMPGASNPLRSKIDTGQLISNDRGFQGQSALMPVASNPLRPTTSPETSDPLSRLHSSSEREAGG